MYDVALYLTALFRQDILYLCTNLGNYMNSRPENKLDIRSRVGVFFLTHIEVETTAYSGNILNRKARLWKRLNR